MKKALLICMTLALFSTNFAQAKASYGSDVTKSVSKELKVLDVRTRIQEDTKKLMAKSLENNPNLFQENRLFKTEGWDFQVGSTHAWWTIDMTKEVDDPDYFISINSTCRAMGENCYVFVEDAIYDDGNNADPRVDLAVAQGIAAAFSDSTPADATKGIYDLVTETFGTPFDIDNDDRIILFILDIRDEYDPATGGGYVAGYNHVYNEFANDEDRPFSNQAEIFYLDADPANLMTEAGLSNGMGTTAHEFQHMVEDAAHYLVNGLDQETFFDEGCSETSTVLCGYEGRGTQDYAQETNILLTTWRDGDDVLTDYQRAYRFMLYWYEQFGGDFLTKFIFAQNAMGNPLVGYDAIDKALPNLDTPTSRRYKDILHDWYIANAINDKTVDPKWGYDHPVAKVEGEQLFTTTFSGSADVNTSGAKYMTFAAGENLTANFHYPNQYAPYSMRIVAIKDLGGLNEVVDVTHDQDMNFPDFGTTYNKLQFIIMNSARTTSTPFEVEYTFSGAGGTGGVTNVELFYDSGITTDNRDGMSRNSGDKEAVWFSKVAGGKIDSIKVALTEAGSMTGAVNEYTGVMRPPLGDVLLDEFTATKVGEEVWSKVDLTSHNLSSDEDFIVSMNYEGTIDVIASADYTRQDYYHTTSFLVDQDQGDNWWWRSIADEADNTIGIWNLLIRAYVSIGGTSGTEVIELLPQAFNLNQNYPNPFNPTTNITYSIPEHSNVKLNVYDALGRQITTLVNEEMSAGTYKTTWNGKDMAGSKVASGIYFYTIEIQDFVQTRKMIMLK